MLQEHTWSGNIRELRNVIERAVVVAKGEKVTPGDLFTVARTPVETAAEDEGPFPTLAELERRHIVAALERCEGNIKAAAGLLGIGRSTLYRKLGEYDISAG
jgi:DNA-binding NtrC family response regulator